MQLHFLLFLLGAHRGIFFIVIFYLSLYLVTVHIFLGTCDSWNLFSVL